MNLQGKLITRFSIITIKNQLLKKVNLKENINLGFTLITAEKLLL